MGETSQNRAAGPGSPVTELLSGLAARSVLIVAVLYVVGRLYAEVYFRQFGIDASSVGLASTDVIGQAAGSTIWLVLLASPGIIAALRDATTIRSPRRPGEKPPSPTRQRATTALAFGLIFGVPVAAVLLFGDPGQIGDWGIPVAAIGVSLVALSSVLLGHADALTPKPKPKPKAPSPDAGGDAAGASSTAATTTTKEPIWVREGMSLRTVAIQSIAAYSLVLAVGVVLGLLGVTRQADEVKAGDVSSQAPWSLAPSASAIQIVGPIEAGLPRGGCVVQIARAGGLWTVWDPRTDRLWQTDQQLVVRLC